MPFCEYFAKGGFFLLTNPPRGEIFAPRGLLIAFKNVIYCR